jgi:flagellar hook-basal body complex protein FliE
MTIPIRPPVGGPVVSPAERGVGIPLGGAADGRESPFGDLLVRALGDVNAMQDTKADVINAFLRGDNVELHQVMAAAEEASLSLELLVETRNKLTDAYRTVMNMQV